MKNKFLKGLMFGTLACATIFTATIFTGCQNKTDNDSTGGNQQIEDEEQEKVDNEGVATIQEMMDHHAKTVYNNLYARIHWKDELRPENVYWTFKDDGNKKITEITGRYIIKNKPGIHGSADTVYTYSITKTFTADDLINNSANLKSTTFFLSTTEFPTSAEENTKNLPIVNAFAEKQEIPADDILFSTSKHSTSKPTQYNIKIETKLTSYSYTVDMKTDSENVEDVIANITNDLFTIKTSNSKTYGTLFLDKNAVDNPQA